MTGARSFAVPSGQSTAGAGVNVRAYGAAGDGVADDTAAILAAAAAVPAFGGALYLPAGWYLINEPVPARDGLTITGDGMHATVIEQTDTTKQGIYGADIVGFTLRDLRLTGPSDGLDPGSVDGILLEQVGLTATANIAIINVMVDHFSRNGVWLQDPIASVLQNVRSQNNAGIGFRITAGTSVTMLSCYANGCPGGGYFLQSTSYSALVACACDSTGTGGVAYDLAGCNNITIVGCGCEDIHGTGYRLSGGSGSTLLSCYSSGNSGIGFHITDAAARIALTNVWERSPGAGATSSITVDAGSSATVTAPTTVTAASYATGTTNVFAAGQLDVTSPGTSINGVDRAAVTNFAAYVLRTAGVDRWALQMSNNSTNDVRLGDSANGGVAFLAESRATAPNLSLLTATKAYGGGVGVVHVPNASTPPTTNPAAGGILYVESGSLKYRGSSGTVTTLGNA